MSRGTKIAVAAAVSGAVVLGALGFVIFSTVSSGEALEYYKQVDEVMARPATWVGRRLRLHGNVVAGTILKRASSLDFKFALHRRGRWVEVTYSGIVPDSFKDCAELVVKGRLANPKLFQAEAISAKCPSKYDGKRQPGVCGEEHAEAVLAGRGR